MTTDRFCKDCVHCIVPPGSGVENSICAVSRRTNPVTGEKSNYFCNVERSFGACGTEGRNFKARVS